MIVTRYCCLNCGAAFTRSIGVEGGHVKYCTDECRQSADRRRRRARRQRRQQPKVGLQAECYECGVTFTADKDTLTEHEDHAWQLVQADTPCRECGKGLAVLDGLFCSEACFVKHWNREIPHNPKHPLTSDDIVWSDRFAETLIPAPARG